MKDYYSLLGIEKDASKTEIKKNYRLLVTKFHPDKNSDPDAPTKFIAITEAYDVLSNRKRRAAYDLFRWEQLKRQQGARNEYGPPPESSRTRRNKAQQKRGLQYQEMKGEFQKQLQLVIESFYIISRYVSHLIGITLSVVILSSVFNHLFFVFEKAWLRGVFMCILIVAIAYGILWLLRNAFQELTKDVEAFSIFYKISKQKASIFSLTALTLLLMAYLVLLKTYF